MSCSNDIFTKDGCLPVGVPVGVAVAGEEVGVFVGDDVGTQVGLLVGEPKEGRKEKMQMVGSHELFHNELFKIRQVVRWRYVLTHQWGKLWVKPLAFPLEPS